eukprot:8605-Prorocentrum_minimum.AAC.1
MVFDTRSRSHNLFCYRSTSVLRRPREMLKASFFPFVRLSFRSMPKKPTSMRPPRLLASGLYAWGPLARYARA